MKRICLGTLNVLMLQARCRKSMKQKDICRGIFAAFGLNIDGFDKTYPSHIAKGRVPVPIDLKNAADKLSFDDVNEGFKQHVLPMIHDSKHESLFRAIKTVLRSDLKLQDNWVIGYIEGYEKRNILSECNFDESALLANIYYYAITKIDNDGEGIPEGIAEIEDDFVEQFDSSDMPIHFRSHLIEQDMAVPLKRSIKDPMFDRIFKPVTTLTVSGMGNPTTASVYYADPIMSCRFRFREMKDFIIDNIGAYVQSRATIKRIEDSTKNPYAVGTQAMRKFILKYGANAESVLGEILLYVFLEQVLDAPKIMTRIELDEARTVSKSDGVHLFTGNLSEHPFHQLVFGASDITGNLEKAVDRVFDKIYQIEENEEDEWKTVYNTTQWTIYDPEATNFMVDLMIPKRDGSHKVDYAFGGFLGYTIELDTPETNNDKYRAAVKEQLKRDIEKVKPYIAQKIRDNGLSGYSFYFYVLPFNDAQSEKISIINEITGGGAS